MLNNSRKLYIQYMANANIWRKKSMPEYIVLLPDPQQDRAGSCEYRTTF